MEAGETLDLGVLGLQVQVRVSDETQLQYDVIGRPRGLLEQEHVHSYQTERFEVLSGAMKLVLAGSEHELGPGQVMEVPPSAPHRQLAAGAGVGHVRVTVTPPGRTLEFMRRLAELARDGRLMRNGLPRPLAGAALVREFAGEGQATRPPAAVQQALAGMILTSAAVLAAVKRTVGLAWGGASREYVFVDEWDVRAAPAAVFDALADARTYPQWWKPVYIDVDADGPPALHKESSQHFKGRLPYHLHTRTRVTELDRPRLVSGEVQGDLRGRGTWTVAPTPDGTHVRFDRRVYADRPLLRALTPLLRPLLRYNHNWAIARARDGLEPYARSHPPGEG